jgi:hypothetical protein
VFVEFHFGFLNVVGWFCFAPIVAPLGEKINAELGVVCGIVGSTKKSPDGRFLASS